MGEPDAAPKRSVSTPTILIIYHHKLIQSAPVDGQGHLLQTICLRRAQQGRHRPAGTGNRVSNRLGSPIPDHVHRLRSTGG
jgi:hypothetical protein